MQEPTSITTQRELLRTLRESNTQLATSVEAAERKQNQIAQVWDEFENLTTSWGLHTQKVAGTALVATNDGNAAAESNDAMKMLQRKLSSIRQMSNEASMDWKVVKTWSVDRGGFLGGKSVYLAFSSASPMLAAATPDGKVSIWNYSQLSEAETLHLSNTGVPNDIRFSSDGSKIAVLYPSGVGVVVVCDVTSGKELYAASAEAIDFSPDSFHIAIIEFKYVPAKALGQPYDKFNGANAYVMDAQDGTKLYSLVNSWGRLWKIAFSPDNKTIAVEQGGGVITIWGADAETHMVIATLQPKKRGILEGGFRKLRFSPNGRWLAAVGNGKVIQVWDTTSHEQLPLWQPFNKEFVDIQFSPQSDILAAANSDKSVTFWSVPDGKVLATLDFAQLEELTSISFSAGWQYMAVGGAGSVILLQAMKPSLPALASDFAQSYAVAEFWYKRESERVVAAHYRTIETRIANQRQQLISELDYPNQPALHSWDDDIWQSWRLGNSKPDVTRVGVISPEGNAIRALPAFTPIVGGRNLILESSGAAKAAANKAMQSVMLRLLASVPPGKLRFTMIDPVGLGQNFAPFMKLADYDDQLVTSKAWTEPHHIEQRLADVAEHMENVIQKYLRNEYQSIEEYNEKAGEVAEPYRVLAIANFPVNFSEAAARRLVSIAANGPRCGVYVIVTVDTEQPMPHGFNLADLERTATVIKHDGSRFVWDDDDFRDCQLELDSPPEPAIFDRIIKAVGEGAKSASRVEVPFERIAPPPAEWWQASSRDGISVALGRSGASKQQMLELGKGTAQHVLVGGKTGSGKSTLLHVLITNLALKYSPQEVELYLVDFKKGVEFKTYASYQLPHARVIAVESEREFGLSVLQGLDVEMRRRGDLFRKAGAQNIAEYRNDSGQPCPRIMLIVDEFQEFFTEDDSISQQATLLLDRLVRQGRAFGVHVLLGSQTLAGAYSLARSTIDQMAVRIALQCSEADARLIMSDDNPAARLLSRPGEAIYNDANGRVEGNNNFQVVWMSDDVREDYLRRIRQFAADKGNQPPQIVFEGNAPAEVEKNKPLTDLLAAPAWANPPRGISAWLGEPIAIKEPTAATFKRQSGSSLLIVGQNDEAALGMSMTALLSIAAQQPPAKGEGAPGACFYVLDFTPADAPYANLLSRLGEFVPHTVRAGSRRQLPDLIAELAAEVDRRLQTDDTGAYPIYLCIYGLHRARDLRPEEDNFSFSLSSEPAPPNPAKQFPTILREGPELGVHTIVWCDTLANLNRTLDRRALREFEQRVAFQMSAEDSSNLVDSPAASKLGQHRALFFSEEQGRAEKFRPYGLPSEEWLAEVGRRLKG